MIIWEEGVGQVRWTLESKLATTKLELFDSANYVFHITKQLHLGLSLNNLPFSWPPYFYARFPFSHKGSGSLVIGLSAAQMICWSASRPCFFPQWSALIIWLDLIIIIICWSDTSSHNWSALIDFNPMFLSQTSELDRLGWVANPLSDFQSQMGTLSGLGWVAPIWKLRSTTGGSSTRATLMPTQVQKFKSLKVQSPNKRHFAT